VKQSGALNPALFCVNFDSSLTQLSRAGVGCHIGLHFVDTPTYTDDLILVAPIRAQLSVCDDDIRFNDLNLTASLLIPRGSAIDVYNAINNINLYFTIRNQETEIADSHNLGHVINTQFDDTDEIADKSSVLNGQANSVICFTGNLSSYVEQRLFSSYFMSLYG
jgi:hypothetical protein